MQATLRVQCACEIVRWHFGELAYQVAVVLGEAREPRTLVQLQRALCSPSQVPGPVRGSSYGHDGYALSQFTTRRDEKADGGPIPTQQLVRAQMCQAALVISIARFVRVFYLLLCTTLCTMLPRISRSPSMPFLSIWRLCACNTHFSSMSSGLGSTKRYFLSFFVSLLLLIAIVGSRGPSSCDREGASNSGGTSRETHEPLTQRCAEHAD